MKPTSKRKGSATSKRKGSATSKRKGSTARRAPAAPIDEAANERTSPRERILDAGLRLMREHAGADFTQTDVARAAGVPQGHLTYYFPRKSDLLAAVAQRSIQAIVEDLAKTLAGRSWPTEPTEARARTLEILKSTAKDSDRTRVLLSAVLASVENRELQEQLVQSASIVRLLIAGGMGAGYEADGEDVELILATLWGLGITHLVHRDLRPAERADALLERLVVWVDALRTPAREAEVDPKPTAKRARSPKPRA
ncbi:Putative transcriptional regulator [Minicystis rosea]|nr:Putative transcriptional regulator [Minicystis rosea]